MAHGKQGLPGDLMVLHVLRTRPGRISDHACHPANRHGHRCASFTSRASSP